LSSSSSSHLNHNHAYVIVIIILEIKPAYKDKADCKEGLITEMKTLKIIGGRRNETRTYETFKNQPKKKNMMELMVEITQKTVDQ